MTWMLDTRCWIRDAGYWMLDIGCWMRDARCRILDARCWISLLLGSHSPYVFELSGKWKLANMHNASGRKRQAPTSPPASRIQHPVSSIHYPACSTPSPELYRFNRLDALNYHGRYKKYEKTYKQGSDIHQRYLPPNDIHGSL